MALTAGAVPETRKPRFTAMPINVLIITALQLCRGRSYAAGVAGRFFTCEEAMRRSAKSVSPKIVRSHKIAASSGRVMELKFTHAATRRTSPLRLAYEHHRIEVREACPIRVHHMDHCFSSSELGLLEAHVALLRQLLCDHVALHGVRVHPHYPRLLADVVHLHAQAGSREVLVLLRAHHLQVPDRLLDGIVALAHVPHAPERPLPHKRAVLVQLRIREDELDAPQPLHLGLRGLSPVARVAHHRNKVAPVPDVWAAARVAPRRLDDLGRSRGQSWGRRHRAIGLGPPHAPPRPLGRPGLPLGVEHREHLEDEPAVHKGADGVVFVAVVPPAPVVAGREDTQHAHRASERSHGRHPPERCAMSRGRGISR
mmetsp:Transcript_53117/g.168607  ORF Transcript_53117/g.168607 Transcript_53117/m.168607 type:complete len:370 (+) Transcript_53117:917-2026(+)